MAEVAAQAKAPVILMHRRGTAATMQQNTHYDDLLGTVYSFLEERVRHCPIPMRRARGRGSGFRVWQVAGGQPRLVGDVRVLLGLGVPVGSGCFAQVFIWKTLGLSAAESLEGSLAAAVLAARAGVHILRVHDVAATWRAVRLVEAVRGQVPC